MTDNIEGSTIIHSVEELVALTGYGSLQGVGDFLTDCCLDCDVQVELEGETMYLIRGEYGVGVGITFPCTLDEVIESVCDIEDEFYTRVRIESLEETIELVEGFVVSIALDETVDPSSLPERLGRRRTTSGVTVQTNDFDYPYERKMRGDATVEDWIRTRLSRHCPGLVVEVSGTMATTLRELRGDYPPRRGRAVPRLR